MWVCYEEILLTLLGGWEIIFLSMYVIYFYIISIILNNLVHVPKRLAAQDKGKLTAFFFLCLNKTQNQTSLLWEEGQKINSSFLVRGLLLQFGTLIQINWTHLFSISQGNIFMYKILLSCNHKCNFREFTFHYFHFVALDLLL